MSNTVTLKDLLDQIDDNCQNFDVTTIDRGNKVRAANRAIESVKRKLGLPSDKDTFDFYYFQDKNFYDTPSAFGEFIQLYYATPDLVFNFPSNPNTAARRWNLYRDTEILRSSGNYPISNRIAWTGQNGLSQLLLSGRNLMQPNSINALDTTVGLTFSSDVSNAVADNNVKVTGSASVKFDIALGLTETTVTMTGNWNIQQLFNNHSAYRLYVDFPIGSTQYFDTVDLHLQTSVGNYYTISTALQVDGTVWNENEWSLLGFPLDNASTVGTPDSQMITSMVIVFKHSSLFAAFNNLRINYFYQVTPDLLTCSYWSQYKGTDSTGAVQKIILDQDSDICSFGDIAPDLIDPIALKAALRLFPQLRGEQSFWQMYKSEYTDTLSQLGKTFPRGRSTGSAGASEILR
jgi:hypothetical protein